MIRKIVFWAIVIGIAYYIITKPIHAGNQGQSLLRGLEHAASQLAKFFNRL